MQLNAIKVLISILRAKYSSGYVCIVSSIILISKRDLNNVRITICIVLTAKQMVTRLIFYFQSNDKHLGSIQ